MRVKHLSALLACTFLTLITTPVMAIVNKHDCDWDLWALAIHSHDNSSGGCTNYTSGFLTGRDGHCDQSLETNGGQVIWSAHVSCTSSGGYETCNVSGVLNCGASSHPAYSLSCSGPVNQQHVAGMYDGGFCQTENQYSHCECGSDGAAVCGTHSGSGSMP